MLRKCRELRYIRSAFWQGQSFFWQCHAWNIRPRKQVYLGHLYNGKAKVINHVASPHSLYFRKIFSSWIFYQTRQSAGFWRHRTAHCVHYYAILLTRVVFVVARYFYTQLGNGGPIGVAEADDGLRTAFGRRDKNMPLIVLPTLFSKVPFLPSFLPLAHFDRVFFLAVFASQTVPRLPSFTSTLQPILVISVLLLLANCTYSANQY